MTHACTPTAERVFSEPAKFLGQSDDLQTAIEEKRVSDALRLIQSSVSVDTELANAETFLHVAVRARLADVVSALLSKGARIDAQNVKGQTPMHVASLKLHTEIAYLLMQHKANISLLDHKNRTALQAPLTRYKSDLQQLVDFYQILFVDYPLIQERLRSHRLKDFQDFLHKNAGQLLEQVGPQKSLELACLLQDKTLALVITEKLTSSVFSEALKQLYTTFSTKSLDVIAYSPYSINPVHYKKGVEDLEVRCPETDIALTAFLKHFDALTFTDEHSPNFFDLRTVKSYVKKTAPDKMRKKFEKMLCKIQNRSVFLGTPEEAVLLQEFHKRMQWALQNVLLKLEELRSKSQEEFCKTRISVMKTLFRTMNLCGGRYHNRTIKLYLRLCRGIVLNFSDKVYAFLQKYREIAFQASLNGLHTTNAYNNIVRAFGREYNLPGYKALNQFDDPFGPFDRRKALDTYHKVYTPMNIIRECILPHLQEDAGMRDSYIGWCKKTMPKDWEKSRLEPIEKCVEQMKEQKKSREEIVAYLQKQDILVGRDESFEEAIQHERESSFLEKEVYDTTTGKFREDVVIQKLVTLEVFRVHFYSAPGPSLFSSIFAKVRRFLLPTQNHFEITP